MTKVCFWLINMSLAQATAGEGDELVSVSMTSSATFESNRNVTGDADIMNIQQRAQLKLDIAFEQQRHVTHQMMMLVHVHIAGRK